MIPNCIPCLEGNEWRYLKDALETNWVSAGGPYIGRFEKAVAGFVGAGQAVALSSGTAALHLALKLAGVGPGQEVLVPSLTFIATANAVTYLGARPVFLDSDRVSLGLDPDKFSHFVKKECRHKNGGLINQRTGRQVAAVLPVHLYGHPADLEPIAETAEAVGLALVEDGAESLGAEYKGQRVGASSRLCALSFNGNKIITTGNGGMILTDDEDLARRARYLCAQTRDDPLEYVHSEIGFNYRLPGLNAALGLAQAEQLDKFVARKRSIQARYREGLKDAAGARLFEEAAWARSSYWTPILLLDLKQHPAGHGPLLARLLEQGIGARPLWQPLNWQKPFARELALDVSQAEAIYRAGLCLPCSCGISEEEIDQTVTQIKACLERGFS
ncbi:MAG: LegC family aminotransferase [Deltaproteobacteria bacterium]|nr:LegC family aminotransferase [Deltaproteobacteria bacterium]